MSVFEKVLNNYAIYHHPQRGYEAVKLGFSWPGFFFTWLWAFIKKLFVIGTVLLVAVLGLRLLMEAGRQTGEPALMWLGGIGTLVVCIGIGIQGNTWRENNLVKRGFQHIDTIQAENADIAITRSLDKAGNVQAPQPAEVTPFKRAA